MKALRVPLAVKGYQREPKMIQGGLHGVFNLIARGLEACIKPIFFGVSRMLQR